jgi:hypothetical protein
MALLPQSPIISHLLALHLRLLVKVSPGPCRGDGVFVWFCQPFSTPFYIGGVLFLLVIRYKSFCGKDLWFWVAKYQPPCPATFGFLSLYQKSSSYASQKK